MSARKVGDIVIEGGDGDMVIEGGSTGGARGQQENQGKSEPGLGLVGWEWCCGAVCHGLEWFGLKNYT